MGKIASLFEMKSWIERALPVIQEHLVYVGLDCAGCQRQPCGNCYGLEQRVLMEKLLNEAQAAGFKAWRDTAIREEAAKDG